MAEHNRVGIVLKLSNKAASHVCGLGFSYFKNLGCEGQIKASTAFARRILGDNVHIPNAGLSKAYLPGATGCHLQR